MDDKLLGNGSHKRSKTQKEEGDTSSDSSRRMAAKNRRLDDEGERPYNKNPQHLKWTILIVSVLTGLLIVAFGSLQYYLPLASKCNSYKPYNSSQLGHAHVLEGGKLSYRFIVVTDLDHNSRREDKKWQSFLKKGTLIITQNLSDVEVQWAPEEENNVLLSNFAAGGRSMELSDLVVFDGQLLTVDDRTGIVYKIENFKDVIPILFLNDGPGNTVKGFKGEWMTVKNQQLYVGGLGKEWTTEKGEFVNFHPMYVKLVSNTGEVEHLNWIENYKQLRRAMGIEYPGYMIHEAGQWSNYHNRWFFLPRRVSTHIYSEIEDEFQGSNILLIANSDFSKVEVKEIGSKGDGSRAFSAFQFLPGTNDDIIVALKSQERDGVAVASYLMVFEVSSGRVLLEDHSLSGAYKFEGIAFV